MVSEIDRNVSQSKASTSPESRRFFPPYACINRLKTVWILYSSFRKWSDSWASSTFQEAEANQASYSDLYRARPRMIRTKRNQQTDTTWQKSNREAIRQFGVLFSMLFGDELISRWCFDVFQNDSIAKSNSKLSIDDCLRATPSTEISFDAARWTEAD